MKDVESMGENPRERRQSMRITNHDASSLGRSGQLMFIVPVGILLNLSAAVLVSSLRLPIYLDAIGTIAVTLLGGLRAGITAGVIGAILGGVVFNPVMTWFAGTQAAIAIYTHIVARRGGLRCMGRMLLVGAGLGVLTGIISAPVLVYIFGGVTGTGQSIITGYLIATGKTALKAVVLSGVATEPVDKILQYTLVVWLLRGMPQSLLQNFRNTALVVN